MPKLLGGATALAILVAAAAPAAAPAATCKAPKLKVGTLCVKRLLDGSNGAVLVAVVRASRGVPSYLGVTIRLKAQVPRTCVGPSANDTPGAARPNASGIRLSGKRFSGTNVSGGTTRIVSGRFVSATKVIVSMEERLSFGDGTACSAKVVNLVITGVSKF